MITLLAAAIGISVANLYYAQPLIGPMSLSLGVNPQNAGLLVTITQVGYGIGVLLLVPLLDLIENRKLIISLVALTAVGLIGISMAPDLYFYVLAALAMGLGASTVQIIVPYATHFIPEDKRGQSVGQLMSGLMVGIMLSRPLASLLTDVFDWTAVFKLSAVLMTVVGLLFYFYLPRREAPALNLNYRSLLASMIQLLYRTPVLYRRGLIQALLFACFCMFWTASALYLAGPEFSLSQTGIAIFALVGIAGAVSAPWAGKASDKGRSHTATILALSAAGFSFVISLVFTEGRLVPFGSWVSLAALAVSAILLDAGVSAHLVLGQRAIFSLPSELRGRLNGLYIAIIFIGGAIGSSLGVWAYSKGGWTWVAGIAIGLTVLSAPLAFQEQRQPRLL